MPTHSLEALLARSNWVHALARSLAADPHAADDLVQDAWVAALERPPRDASRLTQWLATVLQNFARQGWRDAARREARERSVARDEAVESDDALLERLELSRAVAERVASLAEPYRTAILLRYFEGLSPHEIARRLDLPVRTVHTRLNRALGRLRREMEREPERWQFALIPLVSSANRPLRVLLLATGTKVAIAAAALAGIVAWVVLAGGQPGPDPRPSAPIANLSRPADELESEQDIELAQGTVAATGRSQPEAPPAVVTSVAVPETPAAGAHVLHAHVVDSDNVPVGGLQVCLRQFSEPTAKPQHCATSDGRGAFEIRAGGATGLLVVDDPAYTIVLQPQVFDPSEPRELVLVVARVAPLAGVVVDEKRAPLACAALTIRLGPGFRTRFDRVLDTSRSEQWSAKTDAAGRFEIATAPAITAATLHTRFTGHEDDVRDLTGEADWNLEIVLPSMDDSMPVLTGRVVDAEHRPVEGAFVALGGVTVRSDASGAFTLAVPEDEDASVLRAVKEGSLPAELARRGGNREPGAWPDPIVLQLGAAARSIAGRVIDARGAPVAHAEILTDDTTHFGQVTHEQLSFAFPATVESLVRGNMFANNFETNSEGRFELPGLLPRRYRIYAFDRRTLIAALTDPIEAGVLDVVIRLPEEPLHDRIAGRVVGLRGDPVAGAEVSLRRDVQRANGDDGALQSTATNGQSVVSDAQGRFEFRGASRAVTGVDVGGTMLNLGTYRPFATGESLEDVRVTVPLKCHLQLDLSSSNVSGDAFVLLDARGERQNLTIYQGNIVWGQDEFELVGGRSEVLTASEDGRSIVVTKDGVETARIPVELRPGELNVIRP